MPSAKNMFIANIVGWVQKGDKFLFIQRLPDDRMYPDAWNIPGGKIDYEQTESIIEKTLKREIEEETGVVVSDDMDYLGSMSCTFGEHQVLTIFFLTKRVSGEPEPLEETQNAGWFTWEEICSMKKHGLLDYAYAALMKKIG